MMLTMCIPYPFDKVQATKSVKQATLLCAGNTNRNQKLPICRHVTSRDNKRPMYDVSEDSPGPRHVPYSTGPAGRPVRLSVIT